MFSRRNCFPWRVESPCRIALRCYERGHLPDRSCEGHHNRDANRWCDVREGGDHAEFLCLYGVTKRPGLHVWRAGTSIKYFLHPVVAPAGPGWVEFQCDLDASIGNPVRFMLFSFDDRGSPDDFESNAFQRVLPQLSSGDFPPAVWFVSGASRVVTEDPRGHTESSLRVHLISQSRYRARRNVPVGFGWVPSAGQFPNRGSIPGGRTLI